MQDNKSFYKYLGINFGIIIGTILIFSFFFPISDFIVNKFLYVFFANSAGILGLIYIFIFPILYAYFFGNINIEYYIFGLSIIVILNYLILYLIYSISFKYNKNYIGYICTILYLITSLIVGYFIQLLAFV